MKPNREGETRNILHGKYIHEPTNYYIHYLLHNFVSTMKIT